MFFVQTLNIAMSQEGSEDSPTSTIKVGNNIPLVLVILTELYLRNEKQNTG